MQLKGNLAALALSLLVTGCASPDPNATVTINVPDAATFRPLETPMGVACGSLDCHGQPARNLRIYDAHGLRLSPTSISGALEPSTDDEVLADARSFVGLEPELVAQVLRERGASPERLTVVRKARGVQEHKGTVVWPEGSDGDRCLVTWLSSATDTAACDRATQQFSPVP